MWRTPWAGAEALGPWYEAARTAGPSLGAVDDTAAPTGPAPRDEGPIDVSVLERIAGELEAVERALEQIDQGVYDGFVGLDAVPGAAPDRADPIAGAAPVTGAPVAADPDEPIPGG